MNAKITRILAIILAFGMILCCFSACGGKEDEEDESNMLPVLGPMDEWTNPNDDVFVNDGSQMDNSMNIGNSIGNGGSNYTPPSNSTGGSSNWGPSGSTPSYPQTNVTPPSGGTTSRPLIDFDYIEDEVKHFFTHFDEEEEQREVLRLAGFDYDAAQGIFYSHMNPWQRYMGFGDIYDQAAPLTNMWYLTLKIDFMYDDLLWRLQWWKGQYGILEGAELGVYTKDPNNAESPFYDCAEDDQLLRMSYDYYHGLSDYKKGNRLFTRVEQEHWWLTGFKFGVVNPQKNVVRATLYAYDDEMADGIEAGLANVDGKGNGFVPYKEGVTDRDFYIRNGNRFSVVWLEAGYLNYGGTPENPEAPNPDVNIPEVQEPESDAAVQ